jgi:hypothetical protein
MSSHSSPSSTVPSPHAWPVVVAVDVVADVLEVDVLEAEAADVDGNSVSDVVDSPAEPAVSSAEEVVSAGGSLPEGEKQCVQSVHTAIAQRPGVRCRVMMSHQRSRRSRVKVFARFT